MELFGFHPLKTSCSCKFSQKLEYFCLEKYFNTLLKNLVNLLRDAYSDVTMGKRKAPKMSDDQKKLGKLSGRKKIKT